MRPYLAILKDSFREAWSSRVLWLLVVLITVSLLVMVPISVGEKRVTELVPPGPSNQNRRSINDPERFVRRLAISAAQDKPSPAKALWLKFPESLRKELQAASRARNKGGFTQTQVEQLEAAINAQLHTKDFYNSKTWGTLELPKDARDLAEAGVEKLSADDLARFNRLALEAAFPDYIASSGKPMLRLGYAFYSTDTPFPATKREAVTGTINVLLVFLMGWGGIFVSVLVTASIIPKTFEAGAIDLLLSKPIRRSMLFITKFLGGCAFVLLLTTYLMVGFWLLAGLRMGVWNHRLLLAIPLFLFAFAINYSVAALAGVVWRSTIIAIGVTILFWLFCTGLSWIKGGMVAIVFGPQRIVQLAYAGNDLVSISETGAVNRWSEAQQNWAEIAPDTQRPRVWPETALPAAPTLGPVWDAPHQRLLMVQPRLLGPSLMPDPTTTLAIADRAQSWARKRGVRVPPNTAALALDGQNRLLAASTEGIARLDGDPIAKAPQMRVLGMEIPLLSGEARFVPVSDEQHWRPPISAAHDPATDRFVVYDRRSLTVLEAKNGRYVVLAQTKFDEAPTGLVHVAGPHVLLVWADGTVRLYSADKLQLRHEWPKELHRPPRRISSNLDGSRFAIVLHDHTLWLVTPDPPQLRLAPLPAQKSISAAIFADSDSLVVADSFKRISQYNLNTRKVEQRLRPTGDFLSNTYWYGVEPLYTVLPKLRELDNTLRYLTTGESTQAVGPAGEQDLQAARESTDVWGPVRDGAIFIAVMILCSCLYIQWRDL